MAQIVSPGARYWSHPGPLRCTARETGYAVELSGSVRLYLVPRSTLMKIFPPDEQIDLYSDEPLEGEVPAFQDGDATKPVTSEA